MCNMTIKNSNLKFRNSLSKRKKTTHIVLHHAAASKCTVKDIHSRHEGNGCAGVGYHFFVCKNGEIWKGRSLDRVELLVKYM